MKQQRWFRTAAGTLLAIVLVQHAIPQEVSAPKASKKSAMAPATITVFDVPGSKCAKAGYVCTSPAGIDSDGTVTGTFFNGDRSLSHGFYRSADGAFTTLDPPNSVCAEPSSHPPCSAPTAINQAGSIIGVSLSRYVQGFLRVPSGVYTAIEFPAAVGTSPSAISSAGTVTGYYQSAEGSGPLQGFLLDAEGNYTSFNPPGEVNGTYPASINSFDSIVGSYYDSSYGAHGFLRSANGVFTALEATGASSVIPVAIDDGGRILGVYLDASENITGSFVREPNGSYTTINIPGSIQTVVKASDRNGTVIGSYETEDGAAHGFYLLLDGTIGTFDPPGAVATFPAGINAQGAITGYFKDGTVGAFHGFLRIPQ